jgi:DNA-binding MarR family transcriptional regulator
VPTKVDGSPARVLARLSRVVESALADDDLSLSQYRLLAFLAQGDWAASALADRLNVSRPSITGLVDGLVKRELVERRPHPDDRRRIDHVLTASGRAALRDADERADTRLRKLLADVPDDVADDVLDALTRLHTALDARLQEKLR